MAYEEWLTERQLSDSIEKNFDSLWPPYETRTLKRELRVSGKYFDFCLFGETVIEIIEVKITATSSAISQVAAYKKILEDQISIYAQSKQICPPNITMNIIARFVDLGVLEACEALGIGLWQTVISSRGEVKDLDLINPNTGIRDDKIQKILGDLYGSKNI